MTNSFCAGIQGLPGASGTQKALYILVFLSNRNRGSGLIIMPIFNPNCVIRFLIIGVWCTICSLRSGIALCPFEVFLEFHAGFSPTVARRVRHFVSGETVLFPDTFFEKF